MGATWAMKSSLERPRRTSSILGDSQKPVDPEAAAVQGNENSCSRGSPPKFSAVVATVHNSRVRLEREVHSALHRPVERAVHGLLLLGLELGLELSRRPARLLYLLSRLRADRGRACYPHLVQ